MSDEESSVDSLTPNSSSPQSRDTDQSGDPGPRKQVPEKRAGRPFTRLLSGLILAGLLGALVFYGGLYFLALPAIRAADLLLADIGAQQFDAAYARLSPALQGYLSEESFQEWCRDKGLDGFQSISWSARSYAGSITELKGTVTVSDGRKIPLHLQMLRQGDQWKLYAVGSPTIRPVDRLPEESDLQTLAASTLDRLDESIKQGQFEPLYHSAASRLRANIALDELNQQLRFLVRQGLDLSQTTGRQLKWTTTPQLSERRVLYLEGRCDTPLSEIGFKFQYIHEAGDWRLAGIELQSQLRLTETLDQFIDHLQKGETPEALSLCSQRLRDLGLDQFRRLINQLELDRITAVEWDAEFRMIERVHEDGSDDKTQFYAIGELQLDTGRSVSMGFTLVEESEQWRIDGMAPAVPAQPSVSGIERDRSCPRIVAGTFGTFTFQ